jgi:hypothetical protein
MPRLTIVLVLMVMALLSACKAEPRTVKAPELGEAFTSLPLPPSPQFVSRAGGAGALQITVSTPASDTQVANYYRSLLSAGKWRLVSDMKNRDGVTALYAEHDGPPLWVRIWPATDRPGTMVQLTGAPLAKDSVKSKTRSDSSVKHRTAK